LDYEDLKNLTLLPNLKTLDLWKNHIETLEYLDNIPKSLKLIKLGKNYINEKNRIKIERRFKKLGVRVNFG